MLVGRDAETGQISRLLAGAREGRSGVLVVRGEAGVGKSALLEQTVEQAAGFTVLRGAGIETESELTYAALHQVLRPLLSRIDGLPAPQAASLRAAFALSDETVDERFRVALGVLTLLAEAAEDAPVLCIVDDVQWFDHASADALLFAARRLEAEAVALVLAVRDHESGPVVAGLPELRVGSLTPDDARLLLAAGVGRELGPGVADWLIDHANGNPLALVELPGGLTDSQLSGAAPIAGTVPPATSVEQVYLERVARLPDRTRRLLLLAAADETGARATVQRAAELLELDIVDLVPAESAGLLRIDAERLQFRHPLLRSAVYRAAGFSERERSHRMLAQACVAEGARDRAVWHRAAATVGADEDVAGELEQIATGARFRGGHGAAASALERAAELSGDPADAARRMLAAASGAWAAGQPERATALLDRATREIHEPAQRAELDNLRGVIEWRCGSLRDACVTLISGADRIAASDPGLALEMLADAALASWDAGDFPRFGEVGRRITALPRSEEPGRALLADVLVDSIGLSVGTTTGEVPRLRHALAGAINLDDQRLLIWAAIGAELVGEHAMEVALLGRAAALARASGAVDALTVVLESITVQGFLAGHFAVEAESAEGLRLATEAGLPNAANLQRASLAWLAAVRGEAEPCRSLAMTVQAQARANGHGIAASIATWAVALLDLGTGRPEAAVARLVAMGQEPAGMRHPIYVLWSAPDLVEACVRAGQPEDAGAALDALEAFAQPGGPAWALALAARCRALLATGVTAEKEYARAMELHAVSTNAFDRARTALLFGEFLRRERRRTDAREHLRLAVHGFEALRAEPWADRARSELRATGETAPKRDERVRVTLTPQELQIARLVGAGSSNKDVAAQLFLSPRTVEYHLHKVFTKLGISSRAQLIRSAVSGIEPAAALT